jgi:hypothetical protein
MRITHLRRPGPLHEVGVEHLLPAVQALHVRALLEHLRDLLPGQRHLGVTVVVALHEIHEVLL